MATRGELERRIARLEQLARQRAARTPPPRRYGRRLSVRCTIRMLLDTESAEERLIEALAALGPPADQHAVPR
jgi:hypothetical protein